MLERVPPELLIELGALELLPPSMMVNFVTQVAKRNPKLRKQLLEALEAKERVKSKDRKRRKSSSRR